MNKTSYDVIANRFDSTQAKRLRIIYEPCEITRKLKCPTRKIEIVFGLNVLQEK